MNAFSAPILAFITAYLRAMYDGKSKTAQWIEGALLGLATVAVMPVLEWAGLPQKLSVVFGVAFGFVGVETLKGWIKRIFESRFPKDGQ